MVLRGLRGALNWPSIMPRDAILSDSGCFFLQSGSPRNPRAREKKNKKKNKKKEQKRTKKEQKKNKKRTNKAFIMPMGQFCCQSTQHLCDFLYRVNNVLCVICVETRPTNVHDPVIEVDPISFGDCWKKRSEQDF